MSTKIVIVSPKRLLLLLTFLEKQMMRRRGRCNPHVNWQEGVAQPRGYHVSLGMKGSYALLAHISEVHLASCKFLPIESSSHLQGRLSGATAVPMLPPGKE